MSLTVNDIMSYIYTAVPLNDEQNISLGLMDDIAEEFEGQVWNSGGNRILCVISLNQDWQLTIGESSICLYYRPTGILQDDFLFLADEYPNTIIWQAS